MKAEVDLVVRKILQVGNAKGISLPDSFLKGMNLKKGDAVTVKFAKNHLRIRKLKLDSLN